MRAGSPTDDHHAEDPETPQATHISEAYVSAIEAHYDQFFGSRSEIMIHEIKSLGVHIDTYLYPPTEDRPFITAATVGMSALPLETSTICAGCRAKLEATGSVPLRRSELIMYLDANWDFDDPAGMYPVLMMVYAARAPHVDRHAFGYALTYELPERIVPEGSLLTDGYIMNPVFENIDGDMYDFARLEMPDGEICNFFWFVPITRAECYVKRTDGPGALNDILIDNDYFLFDLDRQCYVEYENRHQRRARAKAQRTRAKRRPLTSVSELKCMGCGHTGDGHTTDE
jgi:hypothetical protein